MKKQIISLLLAATITTTGASAFNDTQGHWAESIISAVANVGVISGYADGSFQPNAYITRAEFAAMLGRMFDWQAVESPTFSDIPDGAWYEDVLLRAASAGVMTGSDGRIRPSDRITRQEAAVCLARALGLWQVTRPADYTDFDEVADWAKSEVSALTRFGFISGRGDGRFAPTEDLTRAEAAALIAKLLRPEDDGSNTPTDPTDPSPAPGPDRPTEPERPNEPNTNDYIIFAGKQIPILENLPKSDKISADFVRGDDGRIRYPNARAGVDVSAWQGEIDWDAVARDGVSFAMIRAGYRGYTAGNLNVDSYFERNLNGAKDAGLDVGVYFYSQAITPQEAVEEAELVLELLDGEQLDLPIVFDWELPASKNARTRGLSRDTLTACAEAFCETIADAGYDPMVYFYMSLGYEEYHLDELGDYPFWLAQYSSTPSFYYDYDIWQYTDKGVVEGIDGGVDMNLMFE